MWPMDFRTDNIADVAGLVIGLLILYSSYHFHIVMMKYKARVWDDVARNFIRTSVFFTLGIIITLFTVVGMDDYTRMLVNLIGNVFWVVSTLYAYKTINNLKNALKVIFGV